MGLVCILVIEEADNDYHQVDFSNKLVYTIFERLGG